METRSGRAIKHEPPSSPTESVTTSTMPPPSPMSKKRKIPHDLHLDATSMATPSVARSFNRSHARKCTRPPQLVDPSWLLSPYLLTASAETCLRNQDDLEQPMLMQMRRCSDNIGTGRHSTPSSPQNADASFVQQSFAHPTFTDIGLKQKACNDTLGDLQTLGVSRK